MFVALIKKYGDDNGEVLVANLAHSGFFSLFPLLLVLVTLLGLVASNDPAVRHQVLGAVAHQVPIIGNQLTGSVQELRRSSIIGLVIGLIPLTWGRPAWPRLACSLWGRYGTCPGPRGPATSRGLGARLCSLPSSGSAWLSPHC